MYTGSSREYDVLRQKNRCVFEKESSPWSTDDRHGGSSPSGTFRFLAEAENALLGIHVPRDYGGAGTDMVSRAITMFLVESGDQGVIPASTSGAAGTVTDHRERVLEELFLPEAR